MPRHFIRAIAIAVLLAASTTVTAADTSRADAYAAVADALARSFESHRSRRADAGIARTPDLLRSIALGLGPDGVLDLPRSRTRARADERSRRAARRSAAGTAGTRAVPSLRYLNGFGFFFDSEGTPTGGFNRDGRAMSLLDQAERPFLSANEMANGDAATLVAKLELAAYADEFRQVFGADVFDDTDGAFFRARFAVEAFEQSDPELHRSIRSTTPSSPARSCWRRPNCADSRSSTGPTRAIARRAIRARAVPTARRRSSPTTRTTISACRATPRFRRTPIRRISILACAARSAPISPSAPIFAARSRCRRCATSRRARCSSTTACSRRCAMRCASTCGATRIRTSSIRLDASGLVEKFDDLPTAMHRNVNTEEVPYERRPGQAPRLERCRDRRRRRIPRHADRRLRPRDRHRRSRASARTDELRNQPGDCSDAPNDRPRDRHVHRARRGHARTCRRRSLAQGARCVARAGRRAAGRSDRDAREARVAGGGRASRPGARASHKRRPRRRHRRTSRKRRRRSAASAPIRRGSGATASSTTTIRPATRPRPRRICAARSSASAMRSTTTRTFTASSNGSTRSLRRTIRARAKSSSSMSSISSIPASRSARA